MMIKKRSYNQCHNSNSMWGRSGHITRNSTKSNSTELNKSNSTELNKMNFNGILSQLNVPSKVSFFITNVLISLENSSILSFNRISSDVTFDCNEEMRSINSWIVWSLVSISLFNSSTWASMVAKIAARVAWFLSPVCCSERSRWMIESRSSIDDFRSYRS